MRHEWDEKRGDGSVWRWAVEGEDTFTDYGDGEELVRTAASGSTLRLELLRLADRVGTLESDLETIEGLKSEARGEAEALAEVKVDDERARIRRELLAEIAAVEPDTLHLLRSDVDRICPIEEGPMDFKTGEKWEWTASGMRRVENVDESTVSYVRSYEVGGAIAIERERLRPLLERCAVEVSMYQDLRIASWGESARSRETDETLAALRVELGKEKA